MNKKYILNIENIMDFIFDSDKRDSDSEITEVYVSDDDTKELMLSTKQLREVKGGDNSPKFTIRYDMLKTFLDLISDMDVNGAASFGENLIYNTMINEGFITEINK